MRSLLNRRAFQAIGVAGAGAIMLGWWLGRTLDKIGKALHFP